MDHLLLMLVAYVLGIILVSVPLAFVSARFLTARLFFRKVRRISKLPVFFTAALIVITLFRSRYIFPTLVSITIGLFFIDLVNKITRKTSALDAAIRAVSLLIVWGVLSLIIVIPYVAISLLLYAPFAR